MRHYPVFISIILALAVTAACGRVDMETEGVEPGLVLRLASEMNSNTRLWDVSRLFKEELERAAPEHGIRAGEIAVEFYDQGKIGSERQLLEANFFGVVEIVQVNTSVVSTIEQSYSVLSLPYLFVNSEHLKSTLRGDVGQKLLNKLQDHGMQGLGFYSVGFRNMFYRSGECAASPDQLAGLKIRVMESPVMVNAINAIGPSATPIPFSELYQSIRTGVVDGAENSADVFVSYKFHEAGINCFTFTEHTTDQHVLVANADWLRSIDPVYRERILEVANVIVPEFNRIWESGLQEATNEIEAQGVTVNQVRDKREFIKRVDGLADEFLQNQSEFAKEVYQQISHEGQPFLSE